MEDYEKANAREWDLYSKPTETPKASASKWQVVGSSKAAEKPQQKPEHRKGREKETAFPQDWNTREANENIERLRRPPPNLVIDADNEAQLSWRRYEPPKDSIRIPGDLVLQDRTHETIAQYNGTFIFGEDPKSSSGSMTFGIWGDDKGVAATKRSINSWIEHSLPSKKSSPSTKFAKVISLTPVLREREEKRWKKEVTRQRFRQYPPPGKGFGAIGSFHWPVDEFRPEEILGKSCEALDPIRMDCKCYVVFVKDRSIFQVMGKAEAVKEGLLRIRKTGFQIAARQIPPVRTYLLHWPLASTIPSHVALQPYRHMASISEDQTAKAEQSKSPIGEGMHEDESRLEKQTELSEQTVLSSMLLTLRKLHYYRGNIQMRIRLGKFLAKVYIPPEDGVYTLENYEKMTKMSQFTGEVTQELGNESVEQNTLSALQDSTDLLYTEDAWTEHLADVKPVYTTIFTFTDGAGDFRLTVSWQESQDAGETAGAFDFLSKKWTRLERGADTTTSIVDISLTNLSTGMAWQFDIQASQAVDEIRLPKYLRDFADSLQVDTKAVRKQDIDKPFLVYKSYSTKLKHMQQRTCYRYRLLTSDYTLELTRFQDRTFLSPDGLAFLPASESKMYEPRWGLNIYRIAWDTMFNQNERLPIGEGVNWEHNLETWFPKDLAMPGARETTIDGFGQLMEMLKRVGRVVGEAKEREDLVGGMTVG